MTQQPNNEFSRSTSALRMLVADAVEKAKSGHPGAPMGLAEIAEVIWTQHLRHNPKNPNWLNRDRFVLSNGHASMLLYALLHLTGYQLSIHDLQSFRQLHSKTPGHPEYGCTPGVETTTGPLGQGLANAVGMAIAEKTLGAQFNTDDHTIIDHNTYVIVGDGCLMEGISHEACSLAGTLKLGKLIVVYDDNGISIDGEVGAWFSEDIEKRFESYGWQVIGSVDGHNSQQVDKAIEQAKADTDRPTIICAKTCIGMGSPNKVGSESAHGAPLGLEEIAAARALLDWNYAPFEIPQDIYQVWDCTTKGNEQEQAWQQLWQSYSQAHPQLAKEFSRRLQGNLPDTFISMANDFVQEQQVQATKLATRKASQMCIEHFAPHLPELLGGSADLAASNLTLWSGSKSIEAQAEGNYIYYGVREFAMAAIANGIALHKSFIPYTATFLVFSDYARNAMRMSALMKLRQIYIMTHDSIGLGEDGPTHQPIEQVASLRLIPNMRLWRPCDVVETAVAWQQSFIRTDGPTTLVLTRQGLPVQERTEQMRLQIARGGYVLHATETTPDACIIATGSEVAIAMAAAQDMATKGNKVQVVSMPCVDLFQQQDAEYISAVLPQVPTLAIEAGVSAFWYQFVGSKGRVMGINSFGESAPADDLFAHFRLTSEQAVIELEDMLANG